MAATEGGGGASAPRGPKPKSPPDLYGKRRQLAKVQLLEREITFLEEELKTLDRVQPTSRCCKEVDEFVASRSDPLIQLNQNRHNKKSGCCSCSCSVKKIWGKSCFKSSWICCCFNAKSCSLGTCCNCCTCSTSTTSCCSCFNSNCCTCQSEDDPPQCHHQQQQGGDGATNAVENGGCCLCDCIEQICCQPCCCFPVLSGSATHECCCNFKLSCSCLRSRCCSDVKGIGCCCLVKRRSSCCSDVKGIGCCCCLVKRRSSCKPKCCSRSSTSSCCC